MSFSSRVILLVSTVLVLDTLGVLAISRSRTRAAFRDRAAAALTTAGEAARAGLEDRALEVAAAIAPLVTIPGALDLAEKALEGRVDPRSHGVVHLAANLHPATLDVLRLLDARGTVLSSSPDPERFGVRDGTIAAIATLPPAGVEVLELAVGEGRGVFLVALRRTGSGLVVAGARALDAGFVSDLARRSGASVHLRPLRGAWIGPAPPAFAARGRAHPGVARSNILGDRLELVVVHEDADLARLETRLMSSVLVVGAITLVVSLVLAWVLTRAIGAPLEALTRATVRVAGGDWDHEVRQGAGAREFRSLVTAFNTMQHELRRQRDALRRAERSAAWQDAAKRVAHEIKNTLTPLRLAWERLSGIAGSEGGGGERIPVLRESAEAIAREITALSRFVTEFSELGRWPAPAKRRLDLSSLAAEIARLYGERIETSLADPGVAVVDGDPEQLTRAISNLVQNALDATREDAKVIVRTRRDARGVVLSVTDDGAGMDEETLANVFTPYFTTKPTGTGLGLSIVERIAEANGAVCLVESRPGSGTTVTIRFPTARGAS